MKPDSYSALVHEKDSNLFFKHFYLFLPEIKGYLKHSSDKCVGVNGNKLVFEASCKSAEQVFYIESYRSPLVHVASGQCVADPGSQRTVRYENGKVALSVSYP